SASSTATSPWSGLATQTSRRDGCTRMGVLCGAGARTGSRTTMARVAALRPSVACRTCTSTVYTPGLVGMAGGVDVEPFGAWSAVAEVPVVLQRPRRFDAGLGGELHRQARADRRCRRAGDPMDDDLCGRLCTAQDEQQAEPAPHG